MYSRIRSYFDLLRPWQYYKNLLIFFGIIFSGNLFNFDYYFALILGFVALCTVSSVNYVFNDLKDLSKDRLHPEKQSRPLASGNISILEAYFILIAFILITIAITIILPISDNSKLLFFLTLVAIFITSQSYTFYFKHKALYDVTFIALNYIWRAIAGVVIIDVFLSPWLFALGFLFALFLALAKRRGDIILLGKEAKLHRKVFEEYSLSILDQLITIVIGAMVVAWAIYIIEDPFRANIEKTFTNENLALLSIPLVTISAFKLLMLLQENSKYARRAEFIFINREILILGFLTGIIILLAVYFDTIKIFIDQFMFALHHFIS